MGTSRVGRARFIAVVWLLVGAGMVAASFYSRTPNQQFVRLAAEKALLEKQGAPHDHIDLASVQPNRPVWSSPLFIFGVGAIVLACLQWTFTSSDVRGNRPQAQSP